MTMLRFTLALLLGVATALPQEVGQIVRRIQELAPKEALSLGIETELRAAYLLRESHPVQARAFLERGKIRLAAHPEMIPTTWMVDILFTLEPGAEEIILQHAKPQTFHILIEHYLSHDQPENAVRILQKLLGDEGPALGNMGFTLEKLIPLHPLGAADIYFTLRNSPKLTSKYSMAVSRAPLIFSWGLVRAAANDKAAVRNVLERLLPLFEDKTFLADINVTITVLIGQQEVQTKNARETALLRLGALSRAIAPDLYDRYEKLFDARLTPVNSLGHAQEIANAQPQRPQGKPGFDFRNTPVESALAEWRRTTELWNRLGATYVLMARTDVSLTQKRTVMHEMLATIGLAEKQERAGAADGLIWAASRGGLDQTTIRPAVELLVNNVRDSSYSLDHQAARLIREYGVNIGQNDPSIQSRIALLELEDALSNRYSFTLPSLDGKRISLRDLRGKVVLLNFWATWCGPCRAEKPVLEKVYRELKDKGLMVLAITDEDPAVVQPFVNQFKIGLPVLIDRTRSVFEHYNVRGIPKTVILDRQGRPTARPTAITDEGALRKLLASAGVAP